MRWKALEARFVNWFAQAIEAGSVDLAGRLMHLILTLRRIEPHPPEALAVLLDMLEDGESHATAPSGTPPTEVLASLVEDWDDMLEVFGLAPGSADDCQDPALPYRVNVVASPTFART